ncbi:MAG: DNA-binding transcriptional regulator [Planctomycetaceae bacterium]|jgi:LacI family transcriptional regulator|nr:DNA-binding transcriptional regulator [Planctomycetaceae bacterium]
MTKQKTFSKKKNVLILIETSRSFGRDLIQGITKYVSETRQWNHFLCDQFMAIRNTKSLKQWEGHGLIARVHDQNLKKFYDEFTGKKINLSADGKTSPRYVCLDNEECGRMAANHFLQRGYRHFAFFSMGHTPWSQYRYECFRSALSAHGIDCQLCPQARQKNTYMLPTLWWKGLEYSVTAWIESLPKPVAIFCAYDNHAFYLVNLCNISGISVPENVAILGVDNDESLCLATAPPISSINPNAKQIGYEAAKLLDLMMNRQSLPPLPVVVPPAHIVTRQSTDIIAVDNPLLVKALQFIRTEISNRILVSDVARELNVSKGTLNNLFRRYLNCSPIEEILRVRMEWAKELLRDSSYSVASISNMLGYETPEYFSRAFSREVKMAPMKYRFLYQQKKCSELSAENIDHFQE